MMQRLLHILLQRPFRTISFIFAFLLFFLYHILTFPAVAEKILIGSFQSFTNAKLDLRIDRFSLLRGVEAHDIRCETRDGIPIFSAKRFVLDFFLPSFLAGYPGIRDLALESPKFHLIQTAGVWNYESLFTGSSETEKPEETESDTGSVIVLPVSLKAFFGARIENLSFEYKSETNDGPLAFQIEGVTLRTGFITKKIDRIPLNLELMDIFETIVFSLNPDGPFQLSFRSGYEISGPGKTGFQFFREQKDDTGEFVSRLVVNTEDLVNAGKGSIPFPFHWSVLYDVAYDRTQDRLHFEEFRIMEKGRTHLELRATVNDIMSSRRNVVLQIENSRISLEAPGRLLSFFQGLQKPVMEGDIFIPTLRITGPFASARMELHLKGRDIIYRGPGIPNRIDSLNLLATGEMDLYHIFPSGEKPDAYDAKKRLSYGLFHSIQIQDLSGVYNDGNIKGSGFINPNEGVVANLRIWNFPVDQYSAPYFTGLISADLHLSSNESFKDMLLEGGISIRNSRYLAGKSRSGINHFFLRMNGRILTEPKAVSVIFKNAELSARNEREKPTLYLRGDIGMKFSGSQDYSLQIDEFTFNYGDLKGALPSSLRYSLSSYEPYLMDPPTIKTDLKISIGKTEQTYKGTSLIRIPALRVTDLNLDMDMTLTPASVILRKLTLQGLNNTLQSTLTGSSVKKGEIWHPDMNFSLRMSGKKMVQVHPQMKMQGTIDIDMALNERKASGNLLAKNLDINLDSSGCLAFDPDNPCQHWMIRELNLDLPFSHDLNAKASDVSAGFQESFAAGTTGLLSRPNLTIRRISSDRYPSGQVTEGEYHVIGSPQPGAQNGLEARIHYRNNILFVDSLEGIKFRDSGVEGPDRWFPFGTVYGKQIYYNLADLNKENQGYGLHLQVKQFDLAPYLKGSREGNDGIISGDIQATGHDLRDPLYTTKARLSIHRLSPEFSGFVTRILVPVDMLAWIANYTLAIPSVRVELKDGLVYSSITVRRGGFLSLMIRPDTEEIKQDRVPLARFLERAKAESRALNKGD